MEDKNGQVSEKISNAHRRQCERFQTFSSKFGVLGKHIPYCAVKMRGQIYRCGSLLPPSELLELNSGH